MGKYPVLISEAAAIERRRLSPVQEQKLFWWRNRLAEDPTAGDNIRKDLIPRELKRRFGVESLWRAELPGGWRVLYTIAAKIDIRPQVHVLRILTHKECDRLFRYATS